MLNFSRKVSNLLENKKRTKKSLSEEMGIARNTLSDYLGGKTSIPVEALEKLSEILDVTPCYFFDEDGSEAGSTSKMASMHNKIRQLEEKVNGLETEVMELLRENRELRIKLDSMSNID